MFDISKKTIMSGAIGNIFEVYDYTTWIFFATYLSREFLPPQSNLVDIFFLFLVSYFFRPLGSLVCGVLADIYGRKKILTISILLMGFCTSFITILPSYERVGFFSFVLLLVIRLIQALTFGGEYISSITLLIESCSKNRRGFYGSWVAVGVNSGALLSTLAGALTAYLINNSILPEYSWRLAFLFSIITMGVGFWIRKNSPESYDFIIYSSENEKKNFLSVTHQTLYVLKNNIFKSSLVMILVWFGTTISFLVFAYVPIYITSFHHYLMNEALTINATSLGAVIIAIPFFGYISDKFGRPNTIILCIVIIMFLIFPYVTYLTNGNFYNVFFMHIVMGIPCAGIFAVTPVLITEIFPLPVRCTVANILYSIAAGLGGGLTPIIALNVSKNFNDGSLPIYILTIPAIISLILLVIFIKKS